MTTKQILFRLNDDTATALEEKLADKGISKQFLFTKAVELFLTDKLSFNSNVITPTSDSSKITINSNEVAELIKRSYLPELANLIAKDSTLIALLSEKLVTNALGQLEDNNNKSYQDDNIDLEDKDSKSYQDDISTDSQDSLTSADAVDDGEHESSDEGSTDFKADLDFKKDEGIIITPESQKEVVKSDSTRSRARNSWKDMPEAVKTIEPGTRFTGGLFSREILGLESKSTVSGWVKKIKEGNSDKVPSWFVEQFEYQAHHQGNDKILKK